MDDVKFVELNQLEIKSLLARLSSGVKISAWSDGHNVQTISISSKNVDTLDLFVKGLILQTLPLYLKIGLGDLFYVTIVEQVDISIEDCHRIILDGAKVYKSERRSFDRLLCYPHRQVYLNVEFRKDGLDSTNVLSFSKDDSVIKKMYHSLNGSDSILRLRVLDITTAGLATLVTQSEKELIESGEFKKVWLDFEGESFELSIEGIVSINNYIDAQNKGRHFFRLSLGVDCEKILEDKISLSLGEGILRVKINNGQDGK